MPPWASIESHSSTTVLVSMTMFAEEGRFSAAYRPDTPHPAITTSQFIVLVSICRSYRAAYSSISSSVFLAGS